MWMRGNKTLYLRINIFNGNNVGIILNKNGRWIMGTEECGRVVIKFLGYLSEVMGSQIEKEVCGEIELREIIDEDRMGTSLDDLVILVNGVAKRPETKVKAGDTVTVMPHISGGI